jgi:hypothetical protein
MIRPGRIWWQLSRDMKRGWDASYHDYNTLRRIDDWYWPYWGEKAAQVPVHVLTGGKDWRLSAWMLASFFHFTEVAWPVVIHDDGTLNREARAGLTSLFEGARIIDRAEADAEMEKVLRPFPFCADYRFSHPLALKIFDMAHFAADDRFIIIDSDVPSSHGLAKSWIGRPVPIPAPAGSMRMCRRPRYLLRRRRAKNWTSSSGAG